MHELVRKMPADDQDIILENLVSNAKERIAGQMYQELSKGKRKSAQSYIYFTALSKIVKCKSVSSVCKYFGVGKDKANQYIHQRVVHNVKRICPRTVQKVQTFFKRDDISRVTPYVRETTKKYGARRYMNFPFKVAYKLFKAEILQQKYAIQNFIP